MKPSWWCSHGNFKKHEIFKGMLVPISVKVPLVRNMLYLPEGVRKTNTNLKYCILSFLETSWYSLFNPEKNNFKAFPINSLEKEDNCSSLWISMHVCIHINITAHTLAVLVLFPLMYTKLATISVCRGSTILMKCFRLLIKMSHVVTIWLSSQSWSNWFLW